jgi:hypothetical protein
MNVKSIDVKEKERIQSQIMSDRQSKANSVYLSNSSSAAPNANLLENRPTTFSFFDNQVISFNSTPISSQDDQDPKDQISLMKLMISETSNTSNLAKPSTAQSNWWDKGFDSSNIPEGSANNPFFDFDKKKAAPPPRPEKSSKSVTLNLMD